MGKGAFQELDQVAAVQRFTKYTGRAKRASDISGIIRAAVQASVAGRPGAAYVDIPSDVLMAPLSPSEVTTSSAEANETPAGWLRLGSLTRLMGSGPCQTKHGSDIIDRVCVMVAAVMLQSSGEEQGSLSGIELRQRARASEGDVQRAASMLKQAQRCCPHCIASMHPEQQLPACACWSRSYTCPGNKSLASHQSFQLSDSQALEGSVQLNDMGSLCRPLVVIGKGAAYSQADEALRGVGGPVRSALPSDRHGPRGRPRHARGLRQRGALARACPC